MKKSLQILIAILVLVSMTLSSCATISGLGRDIEHLGGAISRAAN